LRKQVFMVCIIGFKKMDEAASAQVF